MSTLIVIMGVSGCGKSTIGKAVSRALSAPFLEGDDFHPAENIAKMSRGEPLEDTGRVKWLDAIGAEVSASPAPVLVLACSALTPYVQERLGADADAGKSKERQIKWVWLSAPKALIAKRLAARTDHFMPPGLLASQFAALHPPNGAIEIDVSAEPSAVTADILERLEI